MKLSQKLFLLFFIIILPLSIVLFFIFLLMPGELEKGEPAKIFCSAKCGEYDLLESNNNSAYNFIRCECVIDIKIDASPYSGAKTSVETVEYYFDAISLEKITLQEVNFRIQQ